MKIFAILILSITITQAGTWSACDTGGRSVPVTQVNGDIVTLPIPTPKQRRAAFLVSTSINGNQTGKSLVATFTVSASSGTTWAGGYSGGCPTPPNMRLYFTTTTGPYKLSNADRNDTQYWWANPTSVRMVDAENVQVTFNVPLNASFWSDALGHAGTESPFYTSAFNSAVSRIGQAGFSFGIGCFFDTGINTAAGSATLHVHSYAAQ